MASPSVPGFPPELSCGYQISRDTFPLRGDGAQTSAQGPPQLLSHGCTWLNRFEGEPSWRHSYQCRTLSREWPEGVGGSREGKEKGGLEATVVWASLQGNNRIIRYGWFNG